MSGNVEAIQRLVFEMDQQIQKNRAELEMVKLQLNAKETSAKIADATKNELATGSANGRVWEGVGKIFLATPIDDYKKRLSQDESTFEEQKKALKIKENYLETSLEKTMNSMNQILQKK